MPAALAGPARRRRSPPGPATGSGARAGSWSRRRRPAARARPQPRSRRRCRRPRPPPAAPDAAGSRGRAAAMAARSSERSGRPRPPPAPPAGRFRDLPSLPDRRTRPRAALRAWRSRPRPRPADGAGRRPKSPADRARSRPGRSPDCAGRRPAPAAPRPADGCAGCGAQGPPRGRSEARPPGRATSATPPRCSLGLRRGQERPGWESPPDRVGRQRRPDPAARHQIDERLQRAPGRVGLRRPVRYPEQGGPFGRDRDPLCEPAQPVRWGRARTLSRSQGVAQRGQSGRRPGIDAALQHHPPPGVGEQQGRGPVLVGKQQRCRPADQDRPERRRRGRASAHARPRGARRPAIRARTIASAASGGTARRATAALSGGRKSTGARKVRIKPLSGR